MLSYSGQGRCALAYDTDERESASTPVAFLARVTPGVALSRLDSEADTAERD